MRRTRSERVLRASPAAVYAALVDAEAIRAWRVPDGMRSEVHAFEPHEGGHFRISLTYDDPGASGKSAAHTDTYHGHFERLVPGSLVVEAMEFETTDPALAGTMTVRYELAPHEDGTRLVATHEGVPAGVRLEDNAQGWAMSLDKLARWLEGGGR